MAALRRTAYLLCGDWHLASDLVRTSHDEAHQRIAADGAEQRGDEARVGNDFDQWSGVAVGDRRNAFSMRFRTRILDD